MASVKATEGGLGFQKHVKLRYRCDVKDTKICMKNIIRSLSYEFLEIGFACKYKNEYVQNLQIAILTNHKTYIHLNRKRASDLKYGMYLPCVAWGVTMANFYGKFGFIHVHNSPFFAIFCTA